MQSLFDLLQGYEPASKAKDRRGELVSFFTAEIGRPVEFVAVRMSHYSIDQLDALKSAYKDRLLRNGHEAALKYWWWTTRTTAVPKPDMSCYTTAQEPQIQS